MFDRTASGNTAPIRRISGPRSGITGATYSVRMYPPKGLILNPVRGRIGVWSVFDDGDIPPMYLLENASAGEGNEEDFESGIGERFAFNPYTKEVYTYRDHGIETYSVPEIF
jgi:hypothetical protein